MQGQVVNAAEAYSSLYNIKLQLGVFLLPLDGMPVYRRVSLGIIVVSSHLYAWVERGTVRVKLCLAQKHNTMNQGWNLDCSIKSPAH